MAINGKTSIYGIIGKPVSHSFSPSMHNAAFQALNCNSAYLPFPIEPTDLPNLMSAMNVLKVQGFNVTIPYKEKISLYLDKHHEFARLTGSVNTVCLEKNRWVGYSTDGTGFLRSLPSKQVKIQDGIISIVGAGGAAKSIIPVLASQGAHSIYIQNRTSKKTEQLIKSFSQLPYPTKLYNAQPTVQVDLLINTTSVGMDRQSLSATRELVINSVYIVDIIYNPHETPLLKLAKELKKPYQNGMGMLLYQGIEAFEIWTKQKAPVDIMQNALETFTS